MQEVAGEFTTCEEIFIHQGHWELVGKRAPNGDRVGALIDYVAWQTTDRQSIDAIAKQTFEKWIKTFPFSEQVKFHVIRVHVKLKQSSFSRYTFLSDYLTDLK